MQFDLFEVTDGTAANIILIIVAVYLPLALVFARMTQLTMSLEVHEQRDKYSNRTNVSVFWFSALLFVGPCFLCLMAINSGGATGGWALAIWIVGSVSVIVSLWLLVLFSALASMQAEEMRAKKNSR